eukprot:TRINITY_DN54360_c0_g1_i1.p3 TRINITY_DN54360_c0_g1~~TRINITY_DN54360_c0_g1_i1.p3  ORF type:complete len:105 (+),score=4.15 TRINITY_DN54360_c0_g1_i1:347-661(+)
MNVLSNTTNSFKRIWCLILPKILISTKFFFVQSHQKKSNSTKIEKLKATTWCSFSKLQRKISNFEPLKQKFFFRSMNQQCNPTTAEANAHYATSFTAGIYEIFI